MLDEVLKSKENLPARPVDFGHLWGGQREVGHPLFGQSRYHDSGFSIACADEILSIQNLFGQDALAYTGTHSVFGSRLVSPR